MNLLVVLHTLLEERHITRAAEKLQMSQPAVSRALQRLRATFSDQLLVRTQNGYELTSRAFRIQPRLAALLQGVENIITPPQFDPLTATDTIRFTGLDLEVALYLPILTKQIMQQAPNMKVELVSQKSDHFHDLNRGDVHFCLTGIEPESATDQYHRVLIDQMSSVCVMDKNHPLATDMTLDQYCDSKHGLVSLTGSGPGTIDMMLEPLGKKRTVALRLASFMSVADFCAGNELIFTLPTRLAEHISQNEHLILRPLPTEIMTRNIQFYIYWHQRHHHDPMCRWVREQVSTLFSPVISPSATLGAN